MRSRIRVAVLTAALIGQGLIITPASAENHPRVDLVAEGLDNPRGIDVADDGTLYVAEAGSGGDEQCVTFGEGDEASEICGGATSTVTAIDADGMTTAVDDIPSLMIQEGEYAGASDVAVADDGSLYVSVGLGGDTDLRDMIADGWDPGSLLGTVQHYDDGTRTEVADLAAWEAENDPNAGAPSTLPPQGGPSNDSNPNGLLLTSDGELLAADAGGNTVLGIDPATGEITLRASIEDRSTPAPPFLGLPPEAEMPLQSVPTNLAESPDGDVVVGELTGFPFPVGGARVLGLNATETPDVVEEGFTNIIDVTYLDGELYVLEIAHTSILDGFQGALVRVREDGTRTALLRDVLVAPGGLTTGPDGMLYITNNSVGAPGSGSVIRFDPAQAADPAIQSACPPLEVAGTTLSDVSDTTHEEAITCVVWHELFTGFDNGTFGPSGFMTRGQLATTVARMIRATGTDLPEGEEGQFWDIDGGTHDAAINALASADIVNGYVDGSYRSSQRITRAQAVTIVVNAYEFITEAELPAGPDAFDGDAGTHEAATNAAAAMGWVQGTSDRQFSPQLDIRRGQVASVLARVASDLVDGDHLQLPG